MNTDTKRIRIAVDAMGGDFAPKNEIEGALLAINSLESTSPIEIILLGNETEIKETMETMNIRNDNISIVHTNEVITMHDDPVVAIKTKRDSSMIKSIELLKENKVDAFISAGNTGAMLTTSTLLLGRIEGVTRPSIGTFLPTMTPNPTLLIDAGATVDCQARFLYEYAIMGSIYYKEIMKIDNPTVGLLNVGEEKSKGTTTLIEAYKLLESNKNINFLGNIEGRDILQGKTNLVICDGYVGNVILKLAESFFIVVKHAIKQFAEVSFLNKLKAGLAYPVLKEVFSQFNYEIYGGVPLLGVQGIVIIGHGSSTPLAIKNMILSAVNSFKNDICNKIKKELNKESKNNNN